MTDDRKPQDDSIAQGGAFGGVPFDSVVEKQEGSFSLDMDDIPELDDIDMDMDMDTMDTSMDDFDGDENDTTSDGDSELGASMYDPILEEAEDDSDSLSLEDISLDDISLDDIALDETFPKEVPVVAISPASLSAGAVVKDAMKSAPKENSIEINAEEKRKADEARRQREREKIAAAKRQMELRDKERRKEELEKKEIEDRPQEPIENAPVAKANDGDSKSVATNNTRKESGRESGKENDRENNRENNRGAVNKEDNINDRREKRREIPVRQGRDRREDTNDRKEAKPQRNETNARPIRSTRPDNDRAGSRNQRDLSRTSTPNSSSVKASSNNSLGSKSFSAKEVPAGSSKLVSKFYSVLNLIEQSQSLIGEDADISLVGVRTDHQSVLYVCSMVDDAGFKIVRTNKKPDAGSVDSVLEMDYSPDTKDFSLRLDDVLLYSEVDGETDEKDLSHTVSDKLGKFSLLLNEFVRAQEKTREQKRKMNEELQMKKQLAKKLRDF